MDAQHHFGDVLQQLGRNDEAQTAFREMLGIGYRLNLKGKGGAAHNRIGRLYRDNGFLDQAARHLATGLTLFEACGDERGIASSLDDIGKLHWLRGDYRARSSRCAARLRCAGGLAIAGRSRCRSTTWDWCCRTRASSSRRSRPSTRR